LARKAKTYQRRRSRGELSQTIMSAATQLFADKGYAEPSIREIADAAGVALPTLYRLFVDKRDLYVQCVLSAARSIGQEQLRVRELGGESEVVLYRYLRQSMERPEGDRAAHLALVNRVFLDGDDSILSGQFEAYRASAWYIDMTALAARASGGRTPNLRMLILTTFISQLRTTVRMWPEAARDLGTLDQVLQEALAILLPGVDWAAVAVQAGRAPEPDARASTTSLSLR